VRPEGTHATPRQHRNVQLLARQIRRLLAICRI
jgi:hypothetical protein